MFRVVIFSLVLLVMVVPAFSQVRAVIQDVSGKVEVKTPRGQWQPAKIGMDIATGTYISTGFKSTAELEVGATTVWVKPLTRMQLEELIKKEGTQKTALFLRTGSVGADIKSVEGLKHDFVLRSPMATAAVRGTIIEDFDGVVIITRSGAVLFRNNQTGETTIISGGESGQTSGTDAVKGGEDSAAEQTIVVTSTAPPVDAAPPPPVVGRPPSKTTATVTIQLNWD